MQKPSFEQSGCKPRKTLSNAGFRQIPPKPNPFKCLQIPPYSAKWFKSRHPTPRPNFIGITVSQGTHTFKIPLSAPLEGSVRFQGDPYVRRDLDSAPFYQPPLGFHRFKGLSKDDCEQMLCACHMMMWPSPTWTSLIASLRCSEHGSLISLKRDFGQSLSLWCKHCWKHYESDTLWEQICLFDCSLSLYESCANPQTRDPKKKPIETAMRMKLFEHIAI